MMGVFVLYYGCEVQSKIEPESQCIWLSHVSYWVFPSFPDPSAGRDCIRVCGNIKGSGAESLNKDEWCVAFFFFN